MMRALLLSAAALLALPAAAQDVAITNAKLVIGDGSAPPALRLASPAPDRTGQPRTASWMMAAPDRVD